MRYVIKAGNAMYSARVTRGVHAIDGNKPEPCHVAEAQGAHGYGHSPEEACDNLARRLRTADEANGGSA